MCRLLGVVSRDHSSLLEMVPEELPLFTALSEKHKDGWGVAWFAGDRAGAVEGDVRPTVRKGIDTARASNEYGGACAEADGEIVIAHLRRASEGLGLSLANTHPFVEGEVAFAHNGQFDMPEGLRAWVLEQGGRPAEGTTDSELYFSLITLHAREMGWARAIQQAARDLTVRIPELGGRYPEGLNCLLLTPTALIAYAQSDPAQLFPESTWDTYDLRYLAEDRRVIVSSTGYPQDGFATVEQGQAIVVHRGSLEVEVLAPLPDFEIAPAQVEGEAAWAASRPEAPGAQLSLARLAAAGR